MPGQQYPTRRLPHLEALAGVWYDPSGPISSSTGKGAIAKEAVAASYHFGNSTQASNKNVAYMILTPHGTDPYNWLEGNQCAYHSWNAGADLLLHGGTQHSPNEPIAVIGMPYVADSANCFGHNVLAYVHQGSLTRMGREDTYRPFSYTGLEPGLHHQ